MPDPIEFQPIETNSASEIVANHLRQYILLGQFLPGEKLPSERLLAEKLGVSRTTIRDAIRFLTQEGLLKIQRGVKGGSVIQPQSISKKHLHGLIKRSKSEICKFFDYRSIIECATAKLAATRRNNKDLNELYKLLHRMDTCTKTKESRSSPENISQFLATDTNFHIAIAQASKNEYLVKAVKGTRIANILPYAAFFRTLLPNANSRHSNILEAIENKNPELALKEMERHINTTKQSLFSLLKD